MDTQVILEKEIESEEMGQEEALKILLKTIRNYMVDGKNDISLDKITQAKNVLQKIVVS